LSEEACQSLQQAGIVSPALDFLARFIVARRS
jgi:hypothetical protein